MVIVVLAVSVLLVLHILCICMCCYSRKRKQSLKQEDPPSSLTVHGNNNTYELYTLRESLASGDVSTSHENTASI